MTDFQKILARAAGLALAILPAAALAQAPAAGPRPAPAPAARGPSLALALEAAQAAVTTCAGNGYTVAASVIDSGGVLKVLVAGDGARPMAVLSSTRKAAAANKYRLATSDLDAKAKADPTLAAAIAADPTLMARAGALPLMAGADQIGAIGVGGAPGGEKDEACAKAALAQVAGRLK